MYSEMKAFIIWPLFILMLYGCVGTVQDTSQPLTRINEAPVAPLTFAGISQASAISDSRVEVFFFPATGGSGQYTYDIIYGDSPYPTSIPSEVLQPDYRGLLRYTLTGLERLSSHVIKVEVRDRATEVPSNSGVSRTVTTFDNMVADFNGISSASNTPGQDGKDSIKVRWTPARISGGLAKKEWDPKSYEIVVIDSERLSVTDMDVTTYGPTDGRWVFGVNHENMLNEYIVRGLPSNKKFYVRMRAIHEASVDDVYNPRKRSELNTRYIQISTLSGNLADINFQSDSFAANLAAGEQGLSAVNTIWTGASGVFDHYRIYYSIQNGGLESGNLPDLCLTPIQSANGETIFCKKAQFQETGATVSGLNPYTAYQFQLVLCATMACLDGERIIGPVKDITTDPSLPNFNGLKEIQMARNLEEVGSLILSYDIPNFSSGYFDGLILKMRRTLDGSDEEIEITETSNNQYHDSYNFLSENQFTVRGISYIADDPYCFTLYPFKWNTSGSSKTHIPNNIWKCVTPTPEASTSLQFPGLTEGTSAQGVINLSWQPPQVGVFSHYELFWTKNPGAGFIWGNAISEAGNNFNFTNYGRQLISPDQLTFSLNNLSNGTYSFGLITYFSYMTPDGPIRLRSESNSVLQCVVDTANSDPVNCQ